MNKSYKDVEESTVPMKSATPDQRGNVSLKRSDQKMRFIRREMVKGKEVVHDYMLPVGRGFMSGQGPIDWINQGWTPYDNYLAEENQKKVKAEADAKAKEEADAKIAALEAKLKEAEAKVAKKETK